MFEHLIHEETTRSRVVFFVYECCMQDYRAALVEIAEADARRRECTYFSKCNWRCEEHCLSPCSKTSGSNFFHSGGILWKSRSWIISHEVGPSSNTG